MATVEPETTPTPNPPPSEEKTESNQEVANPEHCIKHPLRSRWALWFFKNDKSKTWQANLLLISKFGTAEDFWALTFYPSTIFKKELAFLYLKGKKILFMFHCVQEHILLI
uniref:Eukaryotic translation initiation factor 4E n=1 Tax=Lynx canadensis TaxID=61383 RepID=A0A667GJX3_LYNCA